MIFAFLDEFGHNGPWIARDHKKYNTSPVFGLAGYLMHESKIRTFGTCFLQIKESYLSADPTRNGRAFHEWEKKGTNFFTENSIKKYPSVRDCMSRVLSEIRQRDAKVFYYGREKISGVPDNLNPDGLYKTVFADTIRRINSYCDAKGENFVIVLDEHQAHKELLVTAAKTMFGQQPARRMMCPPFEVKSHLNQNIQAADWIATIVGRVLNYTVDQEGFSGLVNYKTYFETRINDLSTHSSLWRRNPPKQVARNAPVGVLGEKMILAGIMPESPK